MKKENQNHLENSNENNWVFVAIRKDLIAKRTDDYVLVKLSSGYSVIINAKFLRKKEGENHIYASMPYDYKIKARQTEYVVEDKKWHTTDERDIFPRQLTWQLHLVEKELENGKELVNILEYNDALPF